MHEHTLNALRKHYDMLPIGLPETPSGVGRAVLSLLFTEEEAHAALHMTPRGHTAEEIAVALGRTEDEVLGLVESMVSKGVAIRRTRDGGLKTYHLELFAPGLYEFQVGIMNEAVARLVDVLLPELAQEIAGAKTSWAKVVPVSTAPPVDTEVAPYERALDILADAEKIVLAECICRKQKKAIGRGCDRPRDDTCIILSPWAEMYIERGLGQEATVAEARASVERAEQAGLVRMSTNVQKNPLFICQCCTDCCGILRCATEFGQPTMVGKSNFVPVVDRDGCAGCPDCIDICPMDAMSIVKGRAKLDGTKCIGCGLCVTACGHDAISLRRKAEGKVITPPTTWDDLLQVLADERGRTYFV